MKKNYLFLLFVISLLMTASLQNVSAQCTIDSTQTTPGVYPDTIADAVVNHVYDQDITFVMITDTLGFTISNFQIAAITGLPFGMSWTCNNAGNGCNYDPAVNLYGCVHINGVSLVAGSYIANVTVIATIATLGDQVIDYPMPINVLPDTVSNGGFSMTNSSGCSPLTVSFTNNLTGQAAYLWDFANGVNDTTENPPSQVYTTPGDYIITQTVTPAVPPQFFLTEVTVNSIPDNYNHGGLFDNDPDPELFFVISDTAGNTVYDSRPAINNTQPPYTWTLPNIQLSDELYTLHVFDQDSFIISLGDDDLGTITFAGWGTSGSATDSLSGINGLLDVSYTIFQLPVLPIVSTDTVHVYASPAIPVITASGPVTFCEGDSVILSSPVAVYNQWYESGSILVGDTSQDYVSTTSGNYSVQVTSANGCSATSSVTAVVVNPLPPKPTIYAVADTIYCALTGYNLQWYLNGTLIPGATGQYYIPVVSGTYSVWATHSNGCSLTSDPLLIQGVGIEENSLIAGSLSLNPNPTSGLFTIGFEAARATDFTMLITDMTGRIVFEKELKQVAGSYRTELNLSHQSKGIYLFELRSQGFSAQRKLVISE